MPGASPAAHDAQRGGANSNSPSDVARGGAVTNDFGDNIRALPDFARHRGRGHGLTRSALLASAASLGWSRSFSRSLASSANTRRRLPPQFFRIVSASTLSTPN